MMTMGIAVFVMPHIASVSRVSVSSISVSNISVFRLASTCEKKCNY